MSSIGGVFSSSYRAALPSKAPALAAKEEAAAKTKTSNTQTKPNGEPLSDAELAVIEKLAKQDREVRQHEQAHLGAAGGLATSGATYSMETGPDGKQYAVGGEVKIDVGPGSTPEETLSKARIIQAAALAPADPSAADRSIAAGAASMAQDAQIEIAKRSPTAQKLAKHYGQNDYPQSTLAISA